MNVIINNINVMNEIWHVMKMNQAERELLRGKNDLYRTFADNGLAVIFTIVVLFITWMQLFDTNILQVSLINSLLILGMLSLISRDMSRKALLHYLKCLPGAVKSVAENVYNLTKKMLSNAFTTSKTYNNKKKLIWWLFNTIFMIIKFIFILLSSILVFLVIYSLTFGFLFIMNNEVVSLLISIFLVKIALFFVNIDIYSLLMPIIPVFYIINYTSRQLKMTFISEDKIIDGFSHCKGKKMHSSFDGKRLYHDEELDSFLVLFEKDDFVQIYSYTSKYMKMKIDIENWIHNFKVKSKKKVDLEVPKDEDEN